MLNLVKADSNIMKDRVAGIGRFIEQVAKNPDLRDCPHFVAFLTADEHVYSLSLKEEEEKLKSEINKKIVSVLYYD